MDYENCRSLPAMFFETAAREGGHAILVVEDNVVNQRVIEAMLGKRGFAVDCAATGREGLSMIAGFIDQLETLG